MEYLGSGPFLGRPRWENRMTAAPCCKRYSIVGRAARMRVSSLTLPSLIGTLKSTRTRTRFPFTSISRTVFLLNILSSQVHNKRMGSKKPLAFLSPYNLVLEGLGHQRGQVSRAAGVTPLVVIPGNDLDQG